MKELVSTASPGMISQGVGSACFLCSIASSLLISVNPPAGGCEESRLYHGLSCTPRMPTLGPVFAEHCLDKKNRQEVIAPCCPQSEGAFERSANVGYFQCIHLCCHTALTCVHNIWKRDSSGMGSLHEAVPVKLLLPALPRECTLQTLTVGKQ